MNITIEQLNTLMAVSAKDAMKYIESIHGLHVEMDESALVTIDTVLAKLATEHAQTPMKNEHVFTVTSIFGALAGEIFKKHIGGEWFQDSSDEKAPFIVLNYAGKSFPFASVCYQKLVNSPEISVAKYYELAKSGATN